MFRQYIIDGPDGTGKTTLAKKIAEKYEIPYIHLEYKSNQNAFLSQFHAVMRMIQNQEPFVVDRFIWSNLVYSLVYRNTQVIPTFDFMRKNVENICCNIFCLPQNKEKWLTDFGKLCKEREELFDDTKMGEVYDCYKTIFLNSWMRGAKINLFDMYEQDLDDNSPILAFSNKQTV